MTERMATGTAAHGKRTRVGLAARLGLGLVIGLVGAGFLGGCSTNPATGASYFNTLSREEEIAIGQEAAPQLTQEYGGEVRDPELREYVAWVGNRMVPYTEADGPELPWTFTLLDSDVINAFALPGGKVFMSRGLAQRMTNEAQLAGVLGHEIGHVMGEHVDQRLSRAMGVQIGAQLASIFVGQSSSAIAQAAVPALVGYGGQGYLLSYGRSQELESDMLGMRYMSKAGYDPRAQRQVMQILQEASGGASQPEFFSTHPHAETRIEQIDELLRTEYAHTQNNRSYKMFQDRFQNRFLNRLAELPPAMDVGRRGVIQTADAFIAEHATWCGVCRAAAEASAEQ